MDSYQLLKNCTSPEPLCGGKEEGLCMLGYFFNFQHEQAYSKETTALVEMNAATDLDTRRARFDELKDAVVERHEIMRAQFSHVKDCFVCSVAYGLTPAATPKAERVSFTQHLARFFRAGRLSRLKTGFQRV